MVICVQQTNTISINRLLSLKIEESNIKVKDSDNRFIRVMGVQSLRGYILKLTLAQDLNANENYEIEIKFSHNFASMSSPAPSGYIFETYRNDKYPEKKILAFTKFNEFDAKSVFPCIDRIDMKAKFNVRLAYPETIRGFSNGKFKSRKEIFDRPGWVMDEFEETPPLPTFSVAIALLDIESTKNSGLSSVANVQTWAVQFVRFKIGEINGLASAVLKYYSDIFKLQDPLQKLDIIVVPNAHFEIEGSYGLIIMSESFVLSSYKSSSNVVQSVGDIMNIDLAYDFASKLCRTICQQWIGNTVTMSKWQDTWLHQGLNDFLQLECIRHIFPEYTSSFSEKNVIESFTNLLKHEANEEYEPILLLKSYPNLILNSIDYLTKDTVYHFIRLMNFSMGSKLFNESLVKYLDSFKYTNSNLDEALGVFTRTAHSAEVKILPETFTVEEIVESWLYQGGYPLIIVKRNHGTNIISVEQKPFRSLESDIGEKPEEEKQLCWTIPLSYTTKSELKFRKINPRKWLSACNQHVEYEIPGLKDNDWILCNLNLNVPGRVLYEESNWILIQNYLSDQKEYVRINVLTRVSLVSDILAVAEADMLPYKIVFDFMKYLKHEESFEVWKVALKEFDLIRTRLLGSSLNLPYQEYVQEILETVLKNKKFISFPTILRIHDPGYIFRILILQFSCKFGVSSCKDRTSELFDIWSSITEPNPLNIILDPFYKIRICQNVKHGNEEFWNEAWDLYISKIASIVKENILQALSCSTDPKLLLKLLEQCASGEYIAQKDSPQIFQDLSTQEVGYRVMKEFFPKYLYMYRQKMASRPQEGEASLLSASLISYLSTLLDATTKQQELDDIIEMVSGETEFDMSQRVLANSMKNAKRNILWLQKHEEKLKSFLLKDFELITIGNLDAKDTPSTRKRFALFD